MWFQIDTTKYRIHNEFTEKHKITNGYYISSSLLLHYKINLSLTYQVLDRPEIPVNI